jgi:chorismate mutase
MNPESDDIEALREEIARMDARIVEAVAERMRLSALIGRIKAITGMEIEAKEVERRVLERAVSRGKEMGLEEKLVEELINLLVEHSKRAQRREWEND